MRAALAVLFVLVLAGGVQAQNNQGFRTWQHEGVVQGDNQFGIGTLAQWDFPGVAPWYPNWKVESTIDLRRVAQFDGNPVDQSFIYPEHFYTTDTLYVEGDGIWSNNGHVANFKTYLDAVNAPPGTYEVAHHAVYNYTNGPSRADYTAQFWYCPPVTKVKCKVVWANGPNAGQPVAASVQMMSKTTINYAHWSGLGVWAPISGIENTVKNDGTWTVLDYCPKTPQYVFVYGGGGAFQAGFTEVTPFGPQRDQPPVMELILKVRTDGVPAQDITDTSSGGGSTGSGDGSTDLTDLTNTNWWINLWKPSQTAVDGLQGSWMNWANWGPFGTFAAFVSVWNQTASNRGMGSLDDEEALVWRQPGLFGGQVSWDFRPYSETPYTDGQHGTMEGSFLRYARVFSGWLVYLSVALGFYRFVKPRLSM